MVRNSSWRRGNRTHLHRTPRADAELHAAFGADAAEIRAGAARTARIRGSLAALNAAEGVPLDDKLRLTGVRYP